MPTDDYIKRSDAIKALYQGYEKLGLIVYRVSCIEKINKIPAADVEPKRRWISVTERLPENSKSVIIAHQNGVSTGWHNGRYWERGAATGHSKIKTVTHWMPLPEPPKGEDHEIL